MNNFKKSLILPCIASLLVSVPVFANSLSEISKVNDEPTIIRTNNNGRIILSDKIEISPYLATTTVSKNLKNDTWTEIYQDGNYFDAVATIQNNSYNKGNVNIKIEALDKANKTVLLYNTTNLSPNNSYVSGTISGSSYKKYIVYAQTTNKNDNGEYSFTYWDNSPKYTKNIK